MTRRLLLSVFLAGTAAGCVRKEAPAAAAGDSIRTSVGMGGPQLVPRFVGTWVRPAEGRPGQDEAMIMEVGGGLKFINICGRRGVSWAEAEGDSLGLTTTADAAQPATEARYHIRAFTDSVLVLKGEGTLGGRWMRATASVEDRCPGP